ncbi:MAG: methylenetetrahydrofolate reductase [Pseudolabrys sp.]|nr:methylenetetrahydrofolate reductase [Pseudolabrys sp.]
MPTVPPEHACFGRVFSIEATRPQPTEIVEMAAVLPAATPIYLTAVPTAVPDEIVTAAIALRKAGLEPVVHVAARRLPSAEVLQNLLGRLTGEADVRRLLVIGGDVEPVGPFPDALAVIQKGRLREAGIEEIGIAAYPEGHPRISRDRLEASLDEKIASAAAQGLRVHIVTQFSFSAQHILSWLRKLRAGGISHPVRIGLAGPTSLPQLIRFAKRCGVAASLRGLTSGTATALIGNIGPDRIIEALAAAGALGMIYPHYFSFGGAVATARYARRVADMTCAAGQAAAHS